jgi:hypothetical protein
VTFSERTVEGSALVALGRSRLQLSLRARQALVFLPIASCSEDGPNRLRWLGTHREPVLRPFGVDLDQRRVFLRVVDADLLDRPTIPLGACIRDDDAVLRGADLPHPLEFDLHCH